MSDNALEAIKKIANDLLAEEGITPELLDMVMLDIAFSPVIAIRGEKESQAVEVHPTVGGKYLVNHPFVPGAVTADELKVMRLRYLLESKKNQSRNWRMP